jgi:TetR/AcrR family transcriptional repressor of nem operon
LQPQNKRDGSVAQLVEQMTLNHWVQGSSPCGTTLKRCSIAAALFLCLNYFDCYYTDWYICCMKKVSKSERTRQFIVEHTAPIFNTKGFAGTSLTDLTEATRLTKGSIYGNFENKEEVALAVFDHNYSKVFNIIKAEMAGRDTWKERLMVYYQVYDNFTSYPFPVGGCPVLNTATEADDTHPALRKRVVEALNVWRHNIVAIIEKGKAANEFKADTDAEVVAIGMMATIEGAIMIGNVTGQAKYRKAAMKAVEKMILDIVT